MKAENQVVKYQTIILCLFIGSISFAVWEERFSAGLFCFCILLLAVMVLDPEG
jgi:hypothetical protein